MDTSNIGANLVQVSPADPSSTDPLGGLINSIPGLEPILDNITQGVGDGLSDVQSQIVGSIVSELGVKDFYYLYASKMCEGNKGNNGVNIDRCYSYSDANTGE